jgi:hypothetical protein
VIANGENACQLAHVVADLITDMNEVELDAQSRNNVWG